MSLQKKIVNGFCYLKEESVHFVDLVSEKQTKHSLQNFAKAFEEKKVDEHCLVLANVDDGRITPLYNCKIKSSKTSNPIKTSNYNKEELIDLCYKMCISYFKKKSSKPNNQGVSSA